ncbi:hypothetical protein R5R35_011963 [Gryllus longicercus]|uniref:Arrestin-like N-terminal domain-containing protein n=1 Tax=Gryllus longicercus TaxID=2509291 RepID=A0AAN9YZ52_9ORTH
MTLGILIIFDNPSATYIGGQEVTGHAAVDVVKEKKIYGIAVEFRGETQVHVGGEGRTRELYFLEKNLLQDTRQVLFRGSHFYPFSFVLPRSLPSSFEDASYGHVRYTVKVYVLGKWRKKLESTISRFTIVTPLDLNSIRVQEPLTLVKHGYTTRWLCWRSKTQILMGKLPCTRFVPGQEAEVMVGFKNPTAKCMPVICEFVKTRCAPSPRRCARCWSATCWAPRRRATPPGTRASACPTCRPPASSTASTSTSPTSSRSSPTRTWC